MSRPTTAALVEELRQHMVMLLLDPKPLARAPHYYLDYWAQLLAKVQALLADACPYCGPPGQWRAVQPILSTPPALTHRRP